MGIPQIKKRIEDLKKDLAELRRKRSNENCISNLKPNYFKKQLSSSSLLLTKGNNTGQKWQWSTQKASSMS